MAIEAAKGAEHTRKALQHFLDYQRRLAKDSDLWEQYDEITQRLYADLDALQVSLCRPARLISCNSTALMIWMFLLEVLMWLLTGNPCYFFLPLRREGRNELSLSYSSRCSSLQQAEAPAPS